MTDDFFQQQPTPPSQTCKLKWTIFLRSLFFTSLIGFVFGTAFGYLHIKGWIPNAEEGLVLYGVTLGIGAILCTCFVFYQLQQNQLKTEKIKAHQKTR